MLRTGVQRWWGYWFDEGGRLALACVRVAVACAVLFTLSRISETPALLPPAGIYRPVGVWMLLGAQPPPAWLLSLCWTVAWSATVQMLFGAWSRVATLLSCVASIALASLVFSGNATSWSHQYNVVLLAQLALCGGPVGDTLSLDAIVRRLRGLPPRSAASGYQWSLRLAQLAVALMFASAAFFKLAQGQFTLRWALSDSLRHHLLARFDLAGLERPPVAAWLLEEVWRYRTAALLNLGCQLAPMLAVIFARRPRVRALAGAAFVVEVLALGLVLDLWDQHWLPLAAVFVDWDGLVARSRGAGAAAAPARPRPARRVRVFVVGFVAYELLCSFVPTLDRRLNTYPFSSFPMYSRVRANPPYDEHRAYGIAGDRFAAHTAVPLPPDAQYYLDHRHRGTYDPRHGAELRARLTAILELATERYPDLGWHGLRHWVALFVAPPHPAPAGLTRHDIAISGEVTAAGDFRSVLGRWHGSLIELAPVGIDVSGDVQFVLYANDLPSARPLPARRIGPTTWDLGPLPDDPAFLVAIVDGEPWLAAWRRRWRWSR